jgi:hypothetical protein
MPWLETEACNRSACGGLKKVNAVLLWFALAHHLMRGAALRRQAAAHAV